MGVRSQLRPATPNSRGLAPLWAEPLSALRSVTVSRAQYSALGGAYGAGHSQPAPPQLSGRPRLEWPRSHPIQGHPAKSWSPQRWCKVNFNYSPEQADELKLQAGEIVEVIKEVGDEVMRGFGGDDGARLRVRGDG